MDRLPCLHHGFVTHMIRDNSGDSFVTCEFFTAYVAKQTAVFQRVKQQYAERLMLLQKGQL